MSPHIHNSQLSQFGMSKEKRAKGVTAKRNIDIIKQQNDPFWALTNPNNDTVKANSSKAIEHIKMKFQSDIDRITDDLIESAQQTELGQQLVKENAKVRKNKSHLRGDVALFHLNQNLIELEQLQQTQALHGSESKFIRNQCRLDQ